MSDILHNNACCGGFNSLTEKPDLNWGEPVYVNTDPPEPDKPKPVRKDLSMAFKIGLAVIALYLTYEYIIKEK